MKILVTGSTGFLGRRVVKDLANSGYDVVALARDQKKSEFLKKLKIPVRYANLLDYGSIVDSLKGIDIVVHFAAATSDTKLDPKVAYMVNVVGSQTFIDACKINNIKKIIFIATQADNEGVYASTKKLSEELFLNSGLNVVSLKLSFVYGPGESGLFPTMVNTIKSMPAIPVIGHGKYEWRPLYIGDVSKAVMLCINEKKEKRPMYMISGASKITFDGFLDAIMKELKINKMKIHVPYFLVFSGVWFLSMFLKNLPINTDNLKGLVLLKAYDLGPAKSDLGFSSLKIDEGIKLCFNEMNESQIAGAENK